MAALDPPVIAAIAKRPRLGDQAPGDMALATRRPNTRTDRVQNAVEAKAPNSRNPLRSTCGRMTVYQPT